ncbi:MAG: hypothetical protein Q7K44_05235 [Candidatus Liptonbacteria bacterium]|nr:hypothetical protein [Candidatus Liptonbacteria bacterium]
MKKVAITEGVFDYEKTEFNFRSDREDRVWYFLYPCRLCWTRGQRAQNDWFFGEYCPVVVPRHALKIFSADVRKGNSVAIVGGANIFGKVIFFRIIPTNYKETFIQKEFMEPGKGFRTRETFIKIMAERFHGMHDSNSRNDDCLGLDEAVRAEKESFANKSDPLHYLPPHRQSHVEQCDWCKEFLYLDEESLKRQETLKRIWKGRL